MNLGNYIEYQNVMAMNGRKHPMSKEREEFAAFLFSEYGTDQASLKEVDDEIEEFDDFLFETYGVDESMFHAFKIARGSAIKNYLDSTR